LALEDSRLRGKRLLDPFEQVTIKKDRGASRHFRGVRDTAADQGQGWVDRARLLGVGQL
jgi:hypothetical protein